MKTIVFQSAAARQFDALPEPAQDAIMDALVLYAVAGRGDVKKLKGRDGLRLRVGSYRVIFDEEKTTVIAIEIARRSTTTYR